jgi:alpha-amylase
MTALFTLPGIPQIYYGDELGALGADPDNRRDMPQAAWSNAGRATLTTGYLPHPDAIYARTKRLIALRTTHPALYAGDYTESWRPNGSSTNALIFTRQLAGETIIVAINAGAKATGNLSIRSQVNDGASFDELLHDGAAATITSQGGRISISLPAKTSAVYRLQE